MRLSGIVTLFVACGHVSAQMVPPVPPPVKERPLLGRADRPANRKQDIEISVVDSRGGGNPSERQAVSRSCLCSMGRRILDQMGFLKSLGRMKCSFLPCLA
jgi:hypothetical protein